MTQQQVLVIGAGSLGGQFAAHLSRSGADVSILETDLAIVGRVHTNGLVVGGSFGAHTARVPAFLTVDAATAAKGRYDVAFVHVDSNNTDAAGRSAAAALKPSGFAVQIQNGLGNVEALMRAVGDTRVVAGSTMCSAANNGPGLPLLTHHGPTSFGEWTGGSSERVRQVVSMFEHAGYDAVADSNIQTKIWSKAILNSAINPLCAASGLRLGEMARTPELDALQDKVLAELFAVVEANGIAEQGIDAEDLCRQIKAHSLSKFSRPSMLQVGQQQVYRCNSECAMHDVHVCVPRQI
jgi:2-dehydropantoate 2-reductase